jgi:hypothetical protein
VRNDPPAPTDAEVRALLALAQTAGARGRFIAAANPAVVASLCRALIEARAASDYNFRVGVDLVDERARLKADLREYPVATDAKEQQ